MKIALAQLNYSVGAIDANTDKIIKAVEHAKESGADMVIFAEQAISGVPGYDLLRKATFIDYCEEALLKIASHCQNIYALVGLPVLSDNGTHSAAALVRNGNIIQYIQKGHITARREMGFLTEGTGFEYVTIKDKKCAITVGEDARFIKEFAPDTDIIIAVNARKYNKGALSTRYESMRNIALREGKPFILTNQIGGSSEIVYDGTSGAFNSRGELKLMLKSFEEDFGIFDTEDTTAGMAEPPMITYNDRTKLLFKGAELGLKDFFEKSDYKKACIGLSGGIDSAVVASIAVSVLGRENVMAIMMPSKFSSEHSVDDAVILANNLGIEYKIIPITEAFENLVKTLNPILSDSEFDNTEENIQARLRTITLMAAQNKLGYVVLNSSNKSENALGMCTLYGDTAGAFSITGDLYKGEMYDLARYINKVAGSDVIPEQILSKEPSSELHPDQKDSDFLPPYEVVDAILYRMIEEGQHREEIINAGFDVEVVEKIHSMLMNSEKKRHQFPPVLRLSGCSFRHERLMPLNNKYGD